MKRMLGIGLHWGYNLLSVLTPLIVIPHLIRQVGMEKYGDLALVQVTSFATLPLVDFGMGSVGAKWINDLQKKVDADRAILIQVLATVATWCIATVAALIYIFAVREGLFLEFLISQISVLASLVPAQFILVHREQQRKFGSVGILSRLVLIAMTLLFVVGKDSCEIFLSLQAIISVLVSLILLTSIRFDFKISIASNDYISALALLKLGWPQIIRRSATLPLSLLLPALLTMGGDQAAVAIYSISEKIRTITWQLASPILAYYSNRYFQLSKGAQGRPDQDKFFTKTMLSVAGLGIALIGSIWAELILVALSVPPSPENILVWRLGCLSSLPGVWVAYLMAIYFPILQKARGLTIGLWLLTASLMCVAAVAVPTFGAGAAVLQMTAWEFAAGILILIYSANRQKAVGA